MIKVGAIRKIWKGWRLLLFAFVDDNSSLKSRFILKEKCMDGKQYLTVGKGVRKDDEVVKLCVCTNSVCSHYKNKSMVWIGIGKWDIISYNPSSLINKRKQ